MQLIWPQPPSLNIYYRTYNGRILLSQKAREYHSMIEELCLVRDGWEVFHKGDLIHCMITTQPKHKRRFDLDNQLKCLLDSLQRVGAIPDDKQITYLRIEDGEMPPDCPFEKGQVTIELEHAD